MCSWTWFFPFHYAPFASDLVRLPELDISFQPGTPFAPFSQLMGVLPAASSHALPAAYGPLMTSPASPIIDFYPTDFASDMNGKRFAWQAITLLPFIDESRLLSTIATVEHTLTPEEAWRNGTRLESVFVRASTPLGGSVLQLEESQRDLTPEERSSTETPLNPHLSGGLNGLMVLLNGPARPPRLRSPVAGMPDIDPNKVVGFAYKLPPHHTVLPVLPEGAMLPEPVVGPGDVPPAPTLWHEEPQYNGGGQNRGILPHHNQGGRYGNGGGQPQYGGQQMQQQGPYGAPGQGGPGQPFFPGGLYGQQAPPQYYPQQGGGYPGYPQLGQGQGGQQGYALTEEAHRLLQRSMVAAGVGGGGGGMNPQAAPFAPVGGYGGGGGYGYAPQQQQAPQGAWAPQQHAAMMWQQQQQHQQMLMMQQQQYYAQMQGQGQGGQAQPGANRFEALGNLPKAPKRDPRAG